MTYKEQNNPEKLIEAYNKAITLNDAYKEQYNYLISKKEEAKAEEIGKYSKNILWSE